MLRALLGGSPRDADEFVVGFKAFRSCRRKAPTISHLSPELARVDNSFRL